MSRFENWVETFKGILTKRVGPKLQVVALNGNQVLGWNGQTSEETGQKILCSFQKNKRTRC